MIATAQHAYESTRPRIVRDAVTVLAIAAILLGAMLVAGLNLLLMCAGVAALLVAALFKPDLATVVVVFSLWANLAPAAVRFHNVPRIAGIAVFLVLCIPLLHYVVVLRKPIRTDAVLGLMCVYLVVQIASVVSSRDLAASFIALRVFVLEGIVLYFLILNAVRTKEVLNRCLWALVLAGALLGTLSVVQFVTKTYQQNYGGLALTQTTTATGERIAPTLLAEGEQEKPRSMGSIGDPNFYAQFMVALLPIAFLRMWAEPRWSMRAAAVLAMAAILGGIVYSYSRGAMVALGALLAGLIVLKYVRLRYAAALLACMLLILVVSDPAYTQRIETLTSVRSAGLRKADASIQERATIQIADLHVFLDHPLLGVGVGQAADYIAQYSNQYGYARLPRGIGAHNMYLEILAETGIAGLATFALLLCVLGRKLLLLRRYWAPHRPEFAHTLAGLLLGILAFLVAGIFLHLAYARFFWLLIAITGAALRIYGSEEDRPVEAA